MRRRRGRFDTRFLTGGCGSGGAVGLGSCLPLRRWRGGWPRFMPAFATLAGRLASVRVRLCGAGGAVCPRFILPLRRRLGAWPRLILPLRFWRGVLPSFTPDFAVLAGCLAFGVPVLAVLLRCLPPVHACCLPHGDKQDGLRYLAFLFRRSRSPFVRSRGVGAVICLCGFTSGLCVYLWRSRRGYRGRWVTELAARPLRIFAQSY